MEVSKKPTGFINIYDMSEPLEDAEETTDYQNAPKKHRFLTLLTGKNNNFRVYRKMDNIGTSSVSYANYRLYGSIKAAIANTSITPDGLCRCDQMSSIVSNLTSMSFNYSTKRIKRLKGSPPMTIRELEAKETQEKEKRQRKNKSNASTPTQSSPSVQVSTQKVALVFGSSKPICD